MKKFFFLAAAFIVSAAAMAQPKADDIMKVSEEKHDFGKIKHNVPVTTYFEITNTSTKPIIIETAWASCGCTTPEYDKQPIFPGKTTKLKVGYTAATVGQFTKDVFIKFAGVEAPKTLKISGEVVEGTK
jgi:hypothetical protein